MSANRKRPILSSLRTTEEERAAIDRVAVQEGRTLDGLLRSIVLPEIERRVAYLEANRKAAE